MKKILILIGLITTIGGSSIYCVDETELLSLASSTEYSVEQKETAFNIVADSLESQYNKIINEEPIYERNCN
jgi:hypothetical protein